MKLTRTGIVINIQRPKRGKPQVKVTCGVSSSDDFWAKVEKTELPILGSKVIIIYDNSTNLWTVAE